MYKYSKIIAGSLMLLIGSGLAASAADMLPPPPPPVFTPPPPPPAHRIFPYIRGDVSLDIYEEVDISEGADDGTIEFDDIGYNVGIGAGLALNENFRVDVTGEYRTVEGLTLDCDNPCSPDVSHSISSLVGYINGYFDFGNFSGLTPYVGAGVGYASHTVDDWETDPATDYKLDDDSSSSFAWNVQAGVSYDLSRNLTLDANYRYTNLGEVEYSIVDTTGTYPDGEVKYEDLTAHDIRVGLRYYID